MQLNHKLFTLLIVLSFCINAKAQIVEKEQNLTLTGQLGTYPIVMNLIITNDTDCFESRYFYAKNAQDIYLTGNKQQNNIHLEEPGGGIFELVDSAGTINGYWKNTKGKRLDVTLHHADLGQIPNNFNRNDYIDSLKNNDPYNYIRLGLLNFVKDSVEHYHGKSLVWYHEQKSNTPFFRLESGFPTEMRDKINPILEKVHIQLSLDRLTCVSPYGSGEIDYDIAVTFLNEDLIGYKVQSYYDCGGAHPDGSTDGYLLDLNKGFFGELMIYLPLIKVL